jgi:hypothetical protein
MTRQTPENDRRWILFFYSVPSKPVNNRMTVWRKLVKSGAVPLKGAVYILPFSEDRYEFAQWLVAEVKEMKGDAAMVAIDHVDSVTDNEVIALFNQARRNDYLPLTKEMEELSRKLNAIKKGGQGPALKPLAAQLEKNRKAWREIQQVDFFTAPEGLALNDTISYLQSELQQLAGAPKKIEQSMPVSRRSAVEYEGRIWATRARPFVDRMATAWLITAFIDRNASFTFTDETQTGAVSGAVAFDVAGGEFTHRGELCTFEVMAMAFAIKDKAVMRIAQIVHDLDIKDNKFQSPEAMGVEEILNGIRKTAGNDHEALSQGMKVFAMLYAAKKM